MYALGGPKVVVWCVGGATLFAGDGTNRLKACPRTLIGATN